MYIVSGKPTCLIENAINLSKSSAKGAAVHCPLSSSIAYVHSYVRLSESSDSDSDSSDL
jgi:hypothetical protein